MNRSLALSVCVSAWLVACGPKSGPPEAAVSSDRSASDAAGAVADDRSVDAKVAESVTLLQSGTPADLARVVTLLEPHAEEDPTGVVRFDLGLAYLGLERLPDAQAAFEAVLASHPERADAWLYLGQVQEAQGRPEKAESSYLSGIEQDPEHIPVRVAHISLLRRSGQVDDALAAAKDALGVNAQALSVYNNFALAYLDKGDTTLARFILQKAQQGVEGAANNAYIHTNLGWSYYLDGNKPAATEALLKAVELQPDLVPALVYLSRVYLDDRNYSDMVPLLEQAKAVAPTNPNVWVNLGIAYRGVDRLPDARRAYEQALVLAPDEPTPHFNLGILLGDYVKDYDGAIAAFERYVAAGGPDAELAQQYIEDVTKEQERAARRARAEAARKEREAQRQREQERLEEAARAEGEATPDGDPLPADEAPPTDDTGAEEPAAEVEPAADDVPDEESDAAAPVADGADVDDAEEQP